MTEFISVCDILGELFANYKEDDDFKDFIEFNDLGLPLAFLIREDLAMPTDTGEKYIMETWELFLVLLDLEDTGFTDLDGVLDVAILASRASD